MLSAWKAIPDFEWYLINAKGHCRNKTRQGESEEEFFLPSISKGRYCVVHLSVKNNTFTIPLIYFMPKLFPHIFSGPALVDTNQGPWSLSEEIRRRRNLRPAKVNHLQKCAICGYFKARYCYKDSEEICDGCLTKREGMIRSLYLELEKKKIRRAPAAVGADYVYFEEEDDYSPEDPENEDFLLF